MIQQKLVVVGIAGVYRNGHAIFPGEVLQIRLTYHRGHISSHQRRRNKDTADLAVIIGQIGREHAVHLAALQRLHGVFGGGVANRLEIDMGIFQAVGREIQIILQRAGELSRLRILRAEGQIVVLIPYPDRAVGGKPFGFICAEKTIQVSSL